MNIVIPMAGSGKRFKDVGYEFPKPMIKIFGRPMIYWLIKNLNITEKDELYLVIKKELNKYNFKDVMGHIFPKLKINYIELDYDTKGPAETLYLATNYLKLNEKMVSLDCDTFYKEDILSYCRTTKVKNAIYYFSDYQKNPIYSYIKLDGKGGVVGIKEKEKISDNANSGVYYFENPVVYRKYYKQIEKENGELFTSNVYRKMIDGGEQINGIKVDKFYCVGTPLQLQMFCTFEQKFRNDGENIRVCFDIDNCLMRYPTISTDYSTVLPNWRNINLLKFLKDNGCKIILYTARRMKTHSGNMGAIIADIGEITLSKLREYEIKYDEIYFGKPYAHFYIDDLAINPYSQDVEKELGFYQTTVDTRYFNTMIFEKDKVTKKTDEIETLKGEIFWYKNIPETVKNLFPKYIGSTNDSITIEKIKGISFSYLYVTNSLTMGHFKNLLKNITKIHNCTPKHDSHKIYSNYAEKLSKRYLENDYSVFQDSNRIYKELLDLLLQYECRGEGEDSYIHGDPVFSNILLDYDNNIKFLDMRGKLGNELSLYGDKFYDYAKIYQSLVGYDYILLDKDIDHNYSKQFINYFEDFIDANFGKCTKNNIKTITKSLFFSLLPLHKDKTNHCTRFYDLMNNIK